MQSRQLLNEQFDFEFATILLVQKFRLTYLQRLSYLIQLNMYLFIIEPFDNEEQFLKFCKIEKYVMTFERIEITKKQHLIMRLTLLISIENNEFLNIVWYDKIKI